MNLYHTLLNSCYKGQYRFTVLITGGARDAAAWLTRYWANPLLMNKDDDIPTVVAQFKIIIYFWYFGNNNIGRLPKDGATNIEIIYDTHSQCSVPFDCDSCCHKDCNSVETPLRNSINKKYQNDALDPLFNDNINNGDQGTGVPEIIESQTRATSSRVAPLTTLVPPRAFLVWLLFRLLRWGVFKMW